VIPGDFRAALRPSSSTPSTASCRARCCPRWPPGSPACRSTRGSRRRRRPYCSPTTACRASARSACVRSRPSATRSWSNPNASMVWRPSFIRIPLNSWARVQSRIAWRLAHTRGAGTLFIGGQGTLIAGSLTARPTSRWDPAI